MAVKESTKDDIAVLSTPGAGGAIGVIVVDGPGALPKLAGVVRTKRPLDAAADGRVLLGRLLDDAGEVVDEVLVAVRAAEASDHRDRCTREQRSAQRAQEHRQRRPEPRDPEADDEPRQYGVGHRIAEERLATQDQEGPEERQGARRQRDDDRSFHDYVRRRRLVWTRHERLLRGDLGYGSPITTDSRSG